MVRGCVKPVLLVLAASCAPQAGSAERPPNVVFVLADDLGYGDLGCYGQRRFDTPRIDRLAARGVRFTAHYAGSSVCAPSRCALLTGAHTGHCAIRGNSEARGEGQTPMPGETPTIADLLRGAGYTTGAFGKWGLGYPGSESDPRSSGFDRFFGYNCQRHAHRYFTDHLWDDSRRIVVSNESYTPDLILDRALDFIRANRTRPFFCFVPTTLPHAALEIPERERAPFRARFGQFEGVRGAYAGVEVVNPEASFAAMVTRLDGDVGRIVDLLEALSLTDDTLVVFTSDNGPHAEGGRDPEFFDSNGPFRGIKRDLYEGGIRVPAIACWPGHLRSGAECDAAVAGWDWLPTLCELAGAEVPAGLDGVSLTPTLTGVGQQREHDSLYWEFHELGGRQAVRRGPWKAVRYRVGANPKRTPELYHLGDDPGETTDLAAENPGLAADLAQLMDSERTESELYDFGEAKSGRCR